MVTEVILPKVLLVLTLILMYSPTKVNGILFWPKGTHTCSNLFVTDILIALLLTDRL